MSLRKNANTKTIYRKRPEPRRIISFSSLIRTPTLQMGSSNSILVNNNGSIENASWAPMPKLPTPVAVSSTSWKGLRSRVLASRILRAEVA
ncbi:MAG: hypothetical protein CXT72_04500 [Methanobacteriota archaeon]|nr:MAG: hypothetical protein CXT72_04500 [Euryarchaeota archaeon]